MRDKEGKWRKTDLGEEKNRCCVLGSQESLNHPISECAHGDFPKVDVKVLVIPMGRSSTLIFWLSADSKKTQQPRQTINHFLSMNGLLLPQPWIFNFDWNQLGMTVAFLQPVLLLWQPGPLEPTPSLPTHTSHLLLLGHNKFYFSQFSKHHIADFSDFLCIICTHPTTHSWRSIISPPSHSVTCRFFLVSICRGHPSFLVCAMHLRTLR